MVEFSNYFDIEEGQGDEIVVFRTGQVLPRHIVYYIVRVSFLKKE